MPDGSLGFECDVSRDGDTVRVSPIGELDISTISTVEECVDQALSNGEARLVLDLSGLEFMASTGLRLVLQLVRRAETGELELSVVPGPPPVQRVFELTHTDVKVPWADVA